MRTIRDSAYENDVLIEDTYDYYAADTSGNVWYFGEDVVNYYYDDDGNLIGTDDHSAWIAGENGALPGWMMPATPTLGLSYYQEYAAADEALDEALVYAVDQDVEIPGLGWFEDVIIMYETTAIDPSLREFKYYAPGIGKIRADEGLNENLTDPDVIFYLQPGAVPVPASLPLVLSAIGAFALSSRRRE
ncbi:hypothetical protein RGUI_0727 [Rhodovulum sp. P5]|uniref:VPLPA-CTERM sorting domain-containing protein n=1 Tax=Rhodovulum sp. P5 TaxID=1564506 RepID=UPI0009C37BFA|nr:VPLPA-CTERM sorting domain-containing protein [Rhodovulum sp. P5]ARE38868.1 hypothetical protein RGUI_0727 [Rhodovulum sp. P5]